MWNQRIIYEVQSYTVIFFSVIGYFSFFHTEKKEIQFHYKNISWNHFQLHVGTLVRSTLISRKFWLIEKSWHFHTVLISLLWLYTVWKFHNFSITKILREINSLGFQKCKICHLTHLEGLNFDFYEFLPFFEG